MAHRSVLLAVVVICVTACSGGSHASSRPATGGTAGVSARYLQIAAVANGAIDGAKSRLATGGEDLGATESDLRSISVAKRTFDTGLRALDVPPSAKPAVSNLLAADAALEERLDAGSAAATPADLDAQTATILQAGEAAVRAAAAVRSALGLPALV